MLGVVSAIECVRALHVRGRRLPFAIEVVGFADEEGVRFNATLLGSRAIAGTFDPTLLDRADRGGTSMRAALTAFGLDPDPARIAQAARRREQVLAYLELHIEQGPVLEASGISIGVVTSIVGIGGGRVRFTGRGDHAGLPHGAAEPLALEGRGSHHIARSGDDRSHRSAQTLGQATRDRRRYRRSLRQRLPAGDCGMP